MKNSLISVLIFLLIGCSTKDSYNVSHYYNKPEQDSVLTSIVNYIFTAPPYTKMKDRFEITHRHFYADPNLLSQFYINRYYIADDSTNYFYIIRPSPKVSEKRGVGGYFKINKNYKLSGFREVFVTPILSKEEAQAKGAFLFDKMVKGEIQEYLKMKTYVQWPNQASYYDTLEYQWKLDIKKVN